MLPETLYHYTSVTGLRGIIEEAQIRATNIFYLNDNSEAKHAFKVISYTIKKLCKEGFLRKTSDLSAKEEELFLKLIIEQLNVYSKQRDKLNSAEFGDRYVVQNYYVSSFSEKGNDLNQWRGYCRGGGFSIGFKREDIEPTVNERGSSTLLPFDTKLSKCLYTKEEKINLVKVLLEHSVNIFKSEVANIDSDKLMLTQCGFDFSLNLLNIIPLLKNEAFRYENEWRFHLLVQENFAPNKEVKFDDNNKLGLFRPYINIELPKNSEGQLVIDKIFISPRSISNNQQLAKKSLEAYLRSREKKVSCKAIVCSKIPYLES